MTGRFPLQFATWQTIMRIVGAPKGVKTWHCPLPNHRDADPSFSVGPGREPGTTVVACSCGQRKELLDYFRQRGFRLGPMRMAPPKRQPRPVIDTTSIAWRALTPSERRIYELVKASDDSLAYTDFVEAGISSSAISVGLRALQALGFLAVRRSPRLKGCQRYQRNRYQIERGCLRYEPERLSREAKGIALERARAVARAARRGGADISEPTLKADFEPVEKTETGKRRSGDRFVQDQALGMNPRKSDLRIPVPRVSTSDSGGERNVGRRLASLSQDSDRPTMSMKGESSGGASVPEQPPPQAGDPGPTEHWQAPPAPHSFDVWHPPCGGLACAMDGECLTPNACPSLSRRRAAP
jgi:hypothetical protein